MRKILMLMVVPILLLPNMQAANWSKIITKIIKKTPKSSANNHFSKNIPFSTAAKTIATSDGVRYYDEYGVYLGRIVLIYSRNNIERRYYDSSDNLIKREIVEN